jgi:hypothetical protein
MQSEDPPVTLSIERPNLDVLLDRALQTGGETDGFDFKEQLDFRNNPEHKIKLLKALGALGGRATACEAGRRVSGQLNLILRACMADQPDHRPWLRGIRFFHMGLDYYICGRFSLQGQLLDAAGNNYHHAIELYLKGYLAFKQKVPLEELKKKFGHNLVKLWERFRTHETAPQWEPFKDTVEQLNRFEELRYPRDVAEGPAGVENTKAFSPSFRSPKLNPKMYQLGRHEIDHLVVGFYAIVAWTPQGGHLTVAGRQALVFENPVADRWDFRVNH